VATPSADSDATRPPEHSSPTPKRRVGDSSGGTRPREAVKGRLHQGRLRHSPRLSRLVTTIDLFEPELRTLKARNEAEPDRVDTAWHCVADEHLAAARKAADQRRLDDGWDFLHSAQRQAVYAFTRPEIEGAVAVLEKECPVKLVGWRRDAAAANLAQVRAALATTARERQPGSSAPAEPLPGRVPDAAYAALISAKRVLDENSHNTYLRLRLAGQRLLLAAGLMAALLVGLGRLVAADALGSSGFATVTVLHDVGTYWVIASLGVLGALLSFSIGTFRSGGNRRIYELATGRLAATIARILVGAASAIVVATAVQSGVVTLNRDWLLVLAVAAGFSERLVRRIVESLSADAEKPRESASPTPSKAGRDSGGEDPAA